MKKYAFTLIILFMISILLGCSNTQNNGKETETSKKFSTNNTFATYYKNAPYSTGYKQKEKEKDPIAFVDFNIGLYFRVSQGFYGEANSEIIKITVKNVETTQPKFGRIVFSGATLQWPPTDYELIKPANKSVVIPRDYYSNIGGSSFIIDLHFLNTDIGVVTIENWTTIQGTQEEATGHFDQFTSDNGIKDEDLRVNVRYRLEIIVLENGKETTLFKDIDLTLFPDDFLSQSYGIESPYTFENGGFFQQ